MGASFVSVFVVQIYRERGQLPQVYRSSLSAECARRLARQLTLAGVRATVVRFDVAAEEIHRLRFGRRRLAIQCRS